VVREAVEELHLSIFKLHCSVGSFGPDDPRLEPLWRRSSDEGWPTTVHAGSAATGAATDLEIAAVGRVAVRFPRARIIVAHCGAPAIRAALELLRRHEHIYADLCPVVADPAPLKRRDIAGVERKILFGSDTPSVAVRIEESIARVKAWGLDAAQEAAILGGNARALLDRRETMAPRKDDSEPGSSGE